VTPLPVFIDHRVHLKSSELPEEAVIHPLDPAPIRTLERSGQYSRRAMVQVTQCYPFCEIFMSNISAGFA
jgi:hypothetical protein